MTKSTPKNQQHLLSPDKNPFADHHLEVVRHSSIHPYELRCKECACHIKWAKEIEYVWVNHFKPKATFRQLFWAPSYDYNYQMILNNPPKIVVHKANKWITGKELGI